VHGSDDVEIATDRDRHEGIDKLSVAGFGGAAPESVNLPLGEGGEGSSAKPDSRRRDVLLGDCHVRLLRGKSKK
jgi:hypothetical protein